MKIVGKEPINNNSRLLNILMKERLEVGGLFLGLLKLFEAQKGSQISIEEVV